MTWPTTIDFDVTTLPVMSPDPGESAPDFVARLTEFVDVLDAAEAGAPRGVKLLSVVHFKIEADITPELVNWAIRQRSGRASALLDQGRFIFFYVRALRLPWTHGLEAK